MTEKFGRNYRLTIYPIDGGDAIIVTMPLTINFSLIRDVNAQLHRMNISIFNLSESHRSRIFQDRFVLGVYQDAAGNQLVNADGRDTRAFNILLEIGYKTLYRVFYGRMLQASSAREGNNIVTRIEALGGPMDYASVQTNQTLSAGQTLGDVFKYLISQFPNLQLGKIGNYPDSFYRPIVLSGNTWNLLKQYSNNNCFIDNGQVYVLNNNEVLDQVTVISDESGLLDTPRRDLGYLTITTLLEPGVNIGNQIKIQSTIQREFNGTYKVIGVIHQGTISGAVCGHAKSIFRVLAQNIFGVKGFVAVP